MTPTAAIQINATTNNINVADSTNYAAIPFFLDAVGIARIQYPPAILYQNGGYATNDFSSPDINYPGTLNFNTAIPLVDGEIPEGTYTLLYKNRVSKQTTLLNASTADNSISIDIAVTDIVPGMSIVFAGGANDGTRTVLSVTVDGFGRKIIFSSPMASNTATGTITWTVDGSTTVNIDFCNIDPHQSIKQEYFCNLNPPLFISTDESTYAITVNGASITPASITREHYVRPPRINNVPVFADVLTSVASSVITQLWTGAWVTEITTQLVYNIPAYGGNAAYTISMEVEAAKPVIVKCDNTLCCLKNCINTVRTNYNVAKLGNTSDLPALRDQLIALDADYIAYSIYKECGDNDKLSEILEHMKTILGSDCCSDCDEDDGIPRQIIAAYPIAINGLTAVVVPGSLYVTVTPVTVGSTTTYTVDIDTAALTALIVAYLQANPTIITSIVDAMELGVAVSSLAIGTDVGVAFTGDTTNANNIITNVAMSGGLAITDLKLYDPIISNEFPLGTYITAVGATTITVSQNANATVVGSASQVASIAGGVIVAKYKRNIGVAPMFVYIAQASVQDSIVIDGTTQKAKLSGDASAPGNNKRYGTNASGTKGWYDHFDSDYSDTDSAVAVTNVAAIYLSLSLPAGTFIVKGWGGFTTAGRNVVMALKDAATTIVDGIQESTATQTMSVMSEYTSAVPFTLDLVLNGVGGGVTADNIFIQATKK